MQDSEIFTRNIKPHFTYHNPPLPKTRFEAQQGATIGNFEYEQVAPREEYTVALAAAKAIKVPDAVANTCNFRATELAESPEIPDANKVGAGISQRLKPQEFNPDAVANGGAAAPQTFVPASPAGAAAVAPQMFVPGSPAGARAAANPLKASKEHGAPAQPDRGPGVAAEPAFEAPEAPPGGCFIPDNPDPLNKTVVFVPDDSTNESPAMPPPPTHYPGQHSRGGNAEHQSVNRRTFGWGNQLGSQ